MGKHDGKHMNIQGGRKMEENGRDTEGKWVKNGRQFQFVLVPGSPFFQRLRIRPLTALTDGKMGNFATCRHSPPFACGAFQLSSRAHQWGVPDFWGGC